MPKKAKRRPIRRRPQDRSEEKANRQRWLDATARNMLAQITPDQIRSEVADRELLLEEADRAAQLDPSPSSLARYRMARSELEAAKRALELADGGVRRNA